MRTVKRKVHIVGESFQYKHMFEKFGWKVTDIPMDADLIQFTGGLDVTPSLYNKGKHPETHNDVNRDKRELLIFQLAYSWATPMAGICRGGQFLNVMCGGSMYQHVDNHAIAGRHKAIDVDTKREFDVTSTHHQMMNPSLDGHIFLYSRLSTFKETVINNNVVKNIVARGTPYLKKDVEGVYYEEKDALCFQPHPEFNGEDDLAETYMRYIDKYLSPGVTTH